ncbi:hypothetical protein FGB62_66g015 [Gracilaria domingensis]|nr:hypothetical protein FGB62_66g015 [Gracilaria domingensis]
MEHPSPPIAADSSPLRELHTLSANYQWVTVLQSASKLRAADDDGSINLLPHESLHVSAYKVLALLQTRQLERATSEITSLGSLTADNPQYRFETYVNHYGNRVGTFVPFCLHVVALEAAIRRGEVGAIDALHQSAASLHGTQRHIVLSLAAAAHARMGQLEASVEVVLQLVRQNPTIGALQALSRALLMIGDIESAANVLRENNTADDIHLALLHGARGQYDVADAIYQRVVEQKADDVAFKTAVSNGAVCLLQNGRLDEAVEQVEGAVESGAHMLDEGVLFNLATLYELALADGASAKKTQLANRASRCGRQGFDLQLLNA